MADKNRPEDATVRAWSAPKPRGGAAAGAGGPPERGAPGSKTFGPDGRYQVVGQLGKGGFGTVYKAYDHHLAKYVAIKTINVSDVPPEDLKDYVRFFDNEAKTAAQLEHPGVVTVLDYDPYADEPYLVMPLVDCGTLRDSFTEQPRMPWPQVLDLGLQLAEALAYAHAHGIQAHRDIKPANIFVATDGRYRVGDFGIARRQRVGAGVTRSTFFSAGTPRYMAPEQITEPRSVDGRSDLFAICVVLYEALTGRLPFRGVSLDFDPDEDPTSAQKIVDAAFGPPIPIHKLAPEVPAGLARIIERGLQKNPADRFKNCAEFGEALRHLDAGRSLRPAASRGKWLQNALVVVLLVGAGGAAVQFRGEITGQVLDWYTMLAGRPVRVPPEARLEAVAAQAEQYAPVTWRQAEAALAEAEALDRQGQRGRADNLRRDAPALYRKARDEAWQARIAGITSDLDEARTRALVFNVREDPAAGKAFEAGEEERRLAEGLLRENPSQAVASLGAALASYREAGRVAVLTVSEQLDRVKQALGKISAVPDPPAELARGTDAMHGLVADLEHKIEGGRITDVRPQLAAAESQVDDLAKTAAVEVRSRTERARADAPGKGRLSGEQEQRRASAERSYAKAVDRMGQAKKTEDLVEILTLLTDAQLEFASLGSGVADTAIQAAEAARVEADTRPVQAMPKAKEKYEQGVRVLADARSVARRDPSRAVTAAKNAGSLFVEAKSLAAAAKPTVAPAPAPALDEQQARVQPPPPPALPPFEVKQEPRADGVVVMKSGSVMQFWARTALKNVDYRWVFDGQPMNDADGNPGLELEPSSNYRERLHTLQVTVSDRNGREVRKQWMIRVERDGEN